VNPFGSEVFPSYPVTPKRLRFVLPQLGREHSAQAFQPFEEFREVSFITAIQVEFVIRREVKMP
jgi:hypothetical protein